MRYGDTDDQVVTIDQTRGVADHDGIPSKVGFAVSGGVGFRRRIAGMLLATPRRTRMVNGACPMRQDTVVRPIRIQWE